MNRLLVLLILFTTQNVYSVSLAVRNLTFLKENSNSMICESDELSFVRDYNWLKTRETDSVVLNEDTKSAIIANSLLASGRWVKVQTGQSGIHRITFAALKSLGFQTPQKVKVFGFPPGQLPQMNSTPSADDLVQYSTFQTRDKQNNDCLLVYISGSLNMIYDSGLKIFIPDINYNAPGLTVLYLSDDIANEQSVTQVASRTESSSSIVSEFDDFAFFEKEEYNLIQSGSRWFSSQLSSAGSLSQTFKFQDHVNNEPYTISVAAAARCDISSSLNITVNNATIGTMNFGAYSNFVEADYADLKEQIFKVPVEGDDLSFLLKYNSTVGGICWLDYIRVQTRRKLAMQNGQLQFCDTRSVKQGNITEFRIGNSTAVSRIWDVTAPLKPIEIQSSVASNILSFKAGTDTLRRFVSFDPLADFPGIEKVEEVTNQNLHGLGTPDMLIVTSADFRSEADRLAAYHQSKGMEVSVVNVSQIYNEFSGGIKDVTAIRNFVRHLYRKSLTNNVPKLKYLLLFGKGTYDNVHPISVENPCFVPTWQSESSINPVTSFVSDDYFGLLGENEGGQTGIVDIGIGRIPCGSLAEAKAVVDKTLHYGLSPTMDEWRNIVCFVGDDEDNNIHVSASENLADFLNLSYPSFYTDKIYLDAYKAETTPVKSYPGVNKAINSRIKDGMLIFNYVGHANEEGLAQEKILTISDIDSWSNTDKLPVFVTATCEFSRWDLKNKQSAGEHVLFNKVGGGIALFSTTRLVYASSNSEINKSFFRYVFEKDKDGNDLRMGDIIRLAKSELGGSINASKFALLGDPALQISYPKNKVKTLEVNSQVAEQLTDTIKPLSTVSVWGEIQNLKGEKITGYNGFLYPTVYDKAVMFNTLGNNGQSPFPYKVQNSILFKGNVTVAGGEFAYSFKIPKEIDYRIGNGLIRYYSKSTDSDASGSFIGLKLGGSPNTISSDITGPKVRLYLDDENFLTGDKVSKAPILIADLEDDSGINTAGGGIGHDITMTIDDQTSNMIVLNDYYQTAEDTYKSGKVIYQLSDLTDGMHTLRFKAWDLANNSTEVDIRFIVASGLVIKRLSAFPNPFNEYTDILAEINRYDEKMTVEIEIFNQQGVRVDQIKTESGSSGFTTLPIRWNPGVSNHQIASGIYYYRLRVTALDGSVAVKTGEIILTR